MQSTRQIMRLVRYSIFALLIVTLSASAFAGVFVQVSIAPPVLPVYEQPACPGDGYIWTPGYWAYGQDGYYWVPGTWVAAPEPGLLWTPGYWGFSAGFYAWHPGYWGPHIGFYGGVNYGFGYFGSGYEGGYWHGREFFYNRSVNNVHITNVHIYNRTVINNVTVNRVSYNGGRGGIMSRPGRNEMRWEHERHFEPTGIQREHENGARGNRELLASVNHGRPAIAATARPGEFRGRDVVAARGGRDRGMDNRGMDNRGMNREASRPGNSRQMDRPMPRENARNQNVRNNDRPMPRENARNQNVRNNERPMPRQDMNRGGERSAPRPDSRTDNRGAGPHPSAYHPENRGHEAAPRQEGGDRGHDRKSH